MTLAYRLNVIGLKIYKNLCDTKQTYAMMVLMTISLIFSQIREVMIPFESRYCHSAFSALQATKFKLLFVTTTVANVKL